MSGMTPRGRRGACSSRTLPLLLLLGGAVGAAAVPARGTANVDFDVVVYGSSPAGIAAATAAGQLGMRVAVYEPLTMIGGMGAAGALGLHDSGCGDGLTAKWCALNAEAYNVTYGVSEPESFVAVASFMTMLSKAHVSTVKTDCHVISATTAKGADGASRVKSVLFSCEAKPVTATVFIDASYDGDVMVAAGDIAYTAGREANTTYNESLAGARAPSWSGVGGPKGINALKDDGSLIKYVANVSELAPPGAADDALMAFQHRMCIAGGDDAAPWPKPDGYDAEDFLLIQRVVDETGSANAFTSMPPGKYRGYPGPKLKYDLCCGITVAASDQPMLNKGWANASWERRQEIVAEHTYFELGAFYYLANDPKVPQTIRKQFSKYGLCKDEFVDNNNVPVQLYVRISNRLVSDYVMTQNNIGNPRVKPDGIAIGDWSLDEHMTGKYAVPDGKGGFTIMLEGNFWPSIPGPSDSRLGKPPGQDEAAGADNHYSLPYRAIVPKRGTGANVLVPVCLSASAVAYSSTRIETMFMYVGTAAGVAAMQVVSGSAATVQDVNVTKVQNILTQQFDQALRWGGPPVPPPTPKDVPKYYNVTGAGSADWDGQYAVKTSQYGLTYTQTTNTQHSLYAYQSMWRLAVEGKELFYAATTPSSLPPSTGWTVAAVGAKGVAPAPKLAAGPV